MKKLKNIFVLTAVVVSLSIANLGVAQSVKLTEVEWQGTGCYKIEMNMGTAYFEKDNGVSGIKSLIDNEGNDWIASYMEPGPKGEYRGFPNSIGNFGHAGRDSGSKTIIVDGQTEGEQVVLESSNEKFTFQYWFLADRISIKVLKSEGDYPFLFEGVIGGTADAEDYFVTADGKKHIPTPDGEFDDFTPEWFYLVDPKADNVLFMAKTPDDNAPNENHRQILNGNKHNMDLFSFGRTGKEHDYKVFGMNGNEHVCMIGFLRKSRTHIEMAAMIEGFMAKPFESGAPRITYWNSNFASKEKDWYATDEAKKIADNVILFQSPEGGWPKSTDLARTPLTESDIPKQGGGRANSFDNDATTVPMQFLAKMIQATNNKHYINSFNKGLDYLFEAQYPTGGWPQFFPLRKTKYYDRITYNDGAMIRVMEILQEVVKGEEPYTFVDKKRRKLAEKAIEKGIECILKTQVVQNGVRTVWCAQHDEVTLEPAWARAYEPPSLSGSESVGITRFLMSIEKPSEEIKDAVKGAVKWLNSTAIEGVELKHQRNPDGRTERILIDNPDAPLLWSRFYELETNRPLYLDRDSKFRYDFSEISYERRSGYGYHGNWATELLEQEYQQWLEKFHESKIIEIEEGTFTGKLKDSDPGFTGEGFVDTENKKGIFVEVEFESDKGGPHMIGIRHAQGKEDVRPGRLEVNGQVVRENINFNPTGEWTDWKTISVPAELKKGKNVIRLTATWVKGLPNMDHFKFTPEI